jgi:hypothetical protein
MMVRRYIRSTPAEGKNGQRSSFVLLTMLSVRSKFLTTTLVLLAVASVHPAAAQVLIPHGDFDSDFEKYLVATISFVLLCLAAWQFYRNRR